MSDNNFYPEMINRLPEADIAVPGCRGRIFRDGGQQLVFQEFQETVQVADHSHEAQWGAVLDGQIQMTIAGETQTYSRGDTFYIPQGVRHGATIFAGYKAIVVFDQKDRYPEKKK